MQICVIPLAKGGGPLWAIVNIFRYTVLFMRFDLIYHLGTFVVIGLIHRERSISLTILWSSLTQEWALVASVHWFRHLGHLIGFLVVKHSHLCLMMIAESLSHDLGHVFSLAMEAEDEFSYRLWDLENWQIVWSSDVVFNESKMHKMVERPIEVRRLIFSNTLTPPDGPTQHTRAATRQAVSTGPTIPHELLQINSFLRFGSATPSS